MSIHVGEHKATPVRGDCHPVTIYKGDKRIGGAVDSEPVAIGAEPVTVDGTYNDVVTVTAMGRGKQATTTGKNLFHEQLIGEIYQTRFVEFNGKRCVKFVDNAESKNDLIQLPDVPIGKALTLSGLVYRAPGQETKTFDFSIRYSDGSKIAKSGLQSGVPFTITTDINKTPIAITAYWRYEIVCYLDLESLQIEIGDTATPYEPYTGGIPAPNPDYPQELIASEGAVTDSPAEGSNRQPIQIELPILRAIPDGNGGWAARDELVPVPHRPGWYDLKRAVIEIVFTGEENIQPYSNTYLKFTAYMPIAITQAPGVCTHLFEQDRGVGLSFSANISQFAIYFHATDAADELKSLLKEWYLAGNPMRIWCAAREPTTERIYLGPLRSYPQYTTLGLEGDYPPEVTATMRVQVDD